METLLFFIWAIAGALLAALLACVPALHIYNVVGVLLLGGLRLDPELLSALLIGMISGYAMLNGLPSIFMSVPDESTIFVVLPGQKYVRQQRGWEAALLTGLGGLGGLFLLLLITPLASRWLPVLRAILQPHLGWILLSLILFMLMSEWPKGAGRGDTAWQRLVEAWRSLVAGLLTFFLSGLLGFILMYRSLTPVEVAYQGLTPAFIGLFAVPWVLTNLISRVQIPPQHIARSLDVSPGLCLRGILAGGLGGGFAAFFPVVSGGIGGLIAGHATAQRDERVFLISQGANKVVYYVGGLLLFFVPGLHLRRGGMAWMLSGFYTPYAPLTFYRAVAAALLSGVLAFFLLFPLARLMMGLVARVDYRYLSAGVLLLLVLIVALTGGPAGLLIAAVGSGIGLIPVLWGARRMNCMGVLLLPLVLNLAGLGDNLAAWLGLL